MTAPDELADVMYEWNRGPYPLGFRDSKVVMARLAELEAQAENLKLTRRADLTYQRTLAEALTVARNRLGNAVGAVIDSGGYCEGPHDVADAIYRLTAERDELRVVKNDLCEMIDLALNYPLPAHVSTQLQNARVAALFEVPGRFIGDIVPTTYVRPADPLHTHNTPEPDR